MLTTVSVALLHPERDQLLYRCVASSFELPTVGLEKAHWSAEHDVLTAAIEDHLGQRLRLVRLLGRETEPDPGDDDARTRRRLLFLAELVGPVAEAWDDGWTWGDLAASESLADAWHRSLLADLAQGLTEAPPPLRPPWAVERSGWWFDLRQWMLDCLEAQGRQALGELRPVKVWCLAAVYRQETDQGAVYVKVAAPAPPLFVDEAAVTLALAERFPGRVPQVLAARPGPGWLLLTDGGPGLASHGEASDGERRALSLRLARAHAELQVASVARADELLAAGCIDRRLPKLASELESLLEDPLLEAALGDAERWARLRGAEGELRRAIDRLAELDLPPSLVHGDLHLGNVLSRGDGLCIIDWTDACIGPPMVDLIALGREGDAELAAAWRDLYFEAWQALVPRDRLAEAWELNAIILPLHHCVTYRSLQRHVEPSDAADMAGGLKQYAPRLAEALGL